MKFPAHPKAQLRQEMRRRLREIPIVELQAASADLCTQVLKEECWTRARIVGLFHAIPATSEPDLTALMRKPAAGNRVFAFPRVSEGGAAMDFRAVASLKELTLQVITLPGGRKVSLVQPDLRAEPLPISALDLILVPGLAFTRDGKRLGRGGGFYDRFLGTTGLRARKLGLALPCQIVEALPLEPHDHPLDGVLVARV